MLNVNLFYKSFLDYKIKCIKTYINLFKKIHNFEDLKYIFGLIWFALTKIIFKSTITNETIRGR